MGLGGLWKIHVGVILLVISGVVGSVLTLPARAQDDMPEATISALQTRVSELETEVAALLTPAASATSAPDEPSGSNAAGYLVGDALSLLPEGRDGVVDVIAVGSPVRGEVPVVLRNNTDADVLLSGVLGIARNDAGELAYSAEVSMMAPYLLATGHVGIGYAYFGPSDLPSGLTFEFEPQTMPVEEGSVFRQDLEVTEATHRDDAVVGIARNPTDEKLSGPFSVVGVCFDESGAIQGYYAAYAAKNELAPGETTGFTANFYGSGPCETYLLGATGFKGV